MLGEKRRPMTSSPRSASAKYQVEVIQHPLGSVVVEAGRVPDGIGGYRSSGSIP